MKTRAIRRFSFAVAVCATLGFGATTALAGEEKRPCPSTAIGTCGNLARCQELCAEAGGDVANASCREGCCLCPIRY